VQSTEDTEAKAPASLTDEPLTRRELLAWYAYDFANSAYYQVYLGPLLPLLLKWMAEEHAWKAHAEEQSLSGSNSTMVDKESLRIPGLGLTAGSYPLAVNVCTCLVQLICFISFAAFGDFAGYRKRLLVVFTRVGAFVLVLNVLCFSSDMWWLAGLLRVASGTCFGLCLAFYNAYLPVLASVHAEAVNDTSRERLADEISSKGMIAGFVGGTALAVICWVIVLLAACNGEVGVDCSEFSKFFLPSACIALVGVWWASWGQVCFCWLKTRPGPPLPQGTPCFGWQQTWETLVFMTRYRQSLLFMISYFIFSDAYNTIMSIAPLILESNFEGTLSSTMMYACLLPMVGAVGVFLYNKLQACFGLRTKSVIMTQLAVYVVISLCGSLRLISRLGTAGLYIVFAPTMMTLGSIQGYSRSLFSELAPAGREAAMFALYEITDKGSNFLGLGISAGIHNATGSYEHTFFYVLPALIVAALVLYCVDVEKGREAAGKIKEQKPQDEL